MRMINFNKIGLTLTEKYGISLITKNGKDNEGIYIDLIPTDLDKNEGFIIHTSIGWRSISVDFIPGKFSALLIKTMGEAALGKKEIFKAFIKLAVENGEQIILHINNIKADPFRVGEYKAEWKRFDLSLKVTPVSFDEFNDLQIERFILRCIGDLLGMVLALIPLIETDSEIDTSIEGLPEGALMRVEVNKYERSRLNRAVCIDANGTICKVCGFNFGKAYGEIGEGFIHIHHKIPVSKIGKGYIIDPIHELVPVCANCHSMLHRKEPPYTVEELKRIVLLE